MKNMLSIRKAFLFHSIFASVVCIAVFGAQQMLFPGVTGLIAAGVI